MRVYYYFCAFELFDLITTRLFTMKKTYLIACLLIIVTNALQAQQEEFNPIVLECQGKVKYTMPGDTILRPLKLGSTISRDWQLILAENERVDLLQGMILFTFNKPGKHDLKATLPARPLANRGGVTGDFYSRINSIVSMASFESGIAERKKAKEATPATPEKKRAKGKSKKKELPYIPTKGFLLPRNTEFRWDSPTGKPGKWIFQIYDLKTDSLIWQEETRHTDHTFDLSKPIFKPLQRYYWKVSPKANPAETITKQEFVVAPADLDKEAILNVAQERDYMQAGPYAKALWEAYAMETAGMIYEADRRYRELMAKTPPYPIAELVRNTLLMRHGSGGGK